MRCENYVREHIRVISFRQCSRPAKYKVIRPNGKEMFVCGYCLGALKREGLTMRVEKLEDDK